MDGAFTFEGPHDVFTPLDRGRRGHLVTRAGHQRGHRLPPQPGATGASGLRPPGAVRRAGSPWGSGPRSGPRWRSATAPPSTGPSPACGRWSAALRAIFATWETGERLDFRGEFSSHTLMPPTFNPGPNPFGMPDIAIGGLGPQMVRLAAEVADGLLVMPFNSAQHFRQRTLPAIDRGSGPGRPGAGRADGDRGDHRVLRSGRRRVGGGPGGGSVAALLLCLHPGLPPGAGGGRVGGSAARAQ